MKQDRFLLIILGVIGVLMVAAVSLFFTRQNSQTYKPDDSPENIVRNYLLALNQEDYEKAFGYIASQDIKLDYAEFEDRMKQKRPQLLQHSIRIYSSEIEKNQATVVLMISRERTMLFEEPRSYNHRAKLIFQDHVWKLTRMPYFLWP